MDRLVSKSSLSLIYSQTRKILCIAVLAVILFGGIMSSVGTGGSWDDDSNSAKAQGPQRRDSARGDLERATLLQMGRKLVLTVGTAAPVALARLDRLPNVHESGSRYLCLELNPMGRRGKRRICVGGASNAHRKLGLALVNAAGKTLRKKTAPAQLKRPAADRLTLAFVPGEVGLSPHRYLWRVIENRSDCGDQCKDSLPRRGSRLFRLRPVRAIGCTGRAASVARHGQRDRKVVALTFDDGPSSYTPGFLAVLRSKHAHATFFEIGQEIPGRESTMRRMLAEGHEVGNHTTHHGSLPGYWDMAATNALIRAATHFQPCLFRPPGGALNSSVVEAAKRAGMRTILWDVDPTDWASPGAGAVHDRVVGAVGPGSIVLMHDGGGDRSGTLAALPTVIDALRARGYRFATVSQLLGNRLIYRPYG